MTGLEFLIPFLLCLTLVLILRKKFFTKKEETPLRQKDIKKMKKQEKRKNLNK